MKIIVILGVLAFAAIVALGGTDYKKTSSASVPSPGRKTTLWYECPAMPTEEGWKAFSSSVRLGDNVGAATMIADQRGAFLPPKTTVMVKRWIFPGDVEVSIQDGPHMGRQMVMSWACAERVQ